MTVDLDQEDLVTLFSDKPFKRSINLGPLPIKPNSEDSDGRILKDHIIFMAFDCLDSKQGMSIQLSFSKNRLVLMSI